LTLLLPKPAAGMLLGETDGEFIDALCELQQSILLQLHQLPRQRCGVAIQLPAVGAGKLGSGRWGWRTPVGYMVTQAGIDFMTDG
jgi:hypothetical protein